MDEIRCPMCGKSNPAEREVCQYCQARLKPLQAPPPEDASPGGQREQPDWLDSMRSVNDEDSFSEDSSSEAYDEQSELPDWLSNFRGGRKTSDELQDTRSKESAEPESLSESRASSEKESANPELESDDWLSNIRSGAEPEDGNVLDEAPRTEIPEDEGPDWLERIRARQQEESHQDEVQSEHEELSFSGAGDGESAFSGTSSGESATDEGLQDQEQAVPAAEEQQDPDSQDEDLPDWLGQAQSPETPEQEEELPDWLTSPDNAEQAEEPDEELPGWLTQLDLQDSQAEEIGLGPEEIDAETQDAAIEGELEEPEMMADADIPDWLEEIKEPVEAENVSAEDEKQDEPSRDLAEDFEDEPFEGALAEQVTAESEFDLDEPDWLRDLEASSPDLFSGDPEDETPPASESSAGNPEQASGEISQESEEDLSAIESGELPEWLAGISPKDAAYADQQSASQESDQVNAFSEDDSAEDLDLERADLPSWLEAMRPVESAAEDAPVIDDERDAVESAGPLSGLHGVLPAEPDISQVQKPPPYLVKLQVSDTQQANAALLKEILKSEGEPRPIKKQSRITSQNILRILIALVLFAAVLWPLVTGSPHADLPVFTPEVGATSQLINSLNPGEPVLVAVDYEPGWSGEMDAAASAVMDHLMVKGAYLALVSTAPTGPAQAQRLVTLVNRNGGHQYQVGDQYTNLGFIPGSPAGLLSFATSPQQVAPFGQDGMPAWERQPLESVDALSKFALAIVITQSPDTARIWIEQVTPFLGETPLVMVISAQAVPLVRPYYQAVPQLVQGMVTGLTGGAAYDRLNGRQGIAVGYWNAFSLGLVIASGLILAGGLYNAAMGVWSRSKDTIEDEEVT
jgi:hypothetical protein